MKYMWAVCDVKADGKYYAYPIRISVMDNLLSKLAIKGIKAANLCESKKKAKRLRICGMSAIRQINNICSRQMVQRFERRK